MRVLKFIRLRIVSLLLWFAFEDSVGEIDFETLLELEDAALDNVFAAYTAVLGVWMIDAFSDYALSNSAYGIAISGFGSILIAGLDISNVRAPDNDESLASDLRIVGRITGIALLGVGFTAQFLVVLLDTVRVVPPGLGPDIFNLALLLSSIPLSLYLLSDLTTDTDTLRSKLSASRLVAGIVMIVVVGLITSLFGTLVGLGIVTVALVVGILMALYRLGVRLLHAVEVRSRSQRSAAIRQDLRKAHNRAESLETVRQRRRE